MHRNFTAAILCGFSLLASGGCGPNDGLPDRLPVSGTVTL